VVPGIRPVSGFVLIGDSHLALAAGGGAVSQTAYYCMSPASWITWLQILTGHAIPSIANLAVGGTRCDQIALTVDAALSYKPAFIIDSSYTNDNIQQYDYSGSIAVKNEYYNKITSAGVVLVVYIAPPFTGMNATQRSNFRKHVQWCYDYAAVNKNVVIADGASFFIDPASSTLAPFSSYMTDPHHATPTASRAFAVSLLNQQEVKALFPKTRIPFLGANDVTSVASETPQLFDNPGFSGSASTAGTGVTGVAPTYWNVVRNSGSGTVACSLVANSFGGQDFETTFANCVFGDIFQRQITPSAGFLTAIKGKSIYFRYEREYTGVSGVCEDYMQAYVDGNENYGGVNYTTGASARLTDNTNKTETVTIGPFIIPANSSVVRFNFKAIFGASGGGKIAMRNLRVYDSAVMGNTRV
jgi:hypothetical protein